MAIPRNLANIAPHVNASSTEVVVNDGGANLDFRVEGDTDANTLFVDAGNDRVGVKTATPAVALDVVGQVRASTGILFGSDTAAANALDDYEEGTWTPDFSPASGSFSSISWAPRLGRYVKIGNHVWISAAWNIDGISVGTASGDCRISGIPFSPVTSTRWWSSGVGYTSAWTNAPTGIAIYSTQTSLLMTRSSGATGITGITVADLNAGFPNKNEIGFTICFQV